MRLRIFPYSFASESATRLRDGLRALGHNALKVRRDGTYRPRNEDVIVNWGNSVRPAWMTRGTVLNAPERVANASNKLRCFETLREADVPHIPFTTDAEEALGWESPIYVRHTLNGHSGEGIEIFENTLDSDTQNQVDAYRDLVDRLMELDLGDVASTVSERADRLEDDSDDNLALPHAPLYTKKVDNNGEYRVHVFRGEVIDYRKKSRHREDEPTPEQNAVRTLGNGWIYRQSDLARLPRIEELAVRAIEAVGLDFGAVDIINDHNYVARVLEINTAVGMDDTTLANYVSAFDRYATRT